MTVWGLLTKSAEDATKIEEEIDDRIASHNADPDSHGLADMALYAHRTGDVLDHLDEAVKNVKVTSKARAFTAIVGPSGDVDYTDIQDAIDYVNGLGGGKILILPGTYIQTADIVFYDNISLIGFDRELVNIDFNSLENCIQSTGEISPYSTGTISITEDSDIVTGSGTLWLANLSAGQFINILDTLHEIKSIEDDTHLTLETVYQGRSLSFITYFAAEYLENIEIRGLNITGSTKIFGGCRFEYVRNSMIADINVRKNKYGVYINYCDNVTLEFSDVSDNNISIGNGIRFDNNFNCNILYNTMKNNSFKGIDVQSLRSGNNIIGNTASSNGSSGICIGVLGGVISMGNIISGNNCSGNGNHGIYISNANYSTVINNVCNNNDAKGICIENTDYFVLNGNSCYDNSADGIKLVGSIFSCSYNSIVGNICEGNGGYGVLIKSDCIKNIVTSNQLINNTSGAISDLGTDTEIAHNIE